MDDLQIPDFLKRTNGANMTAFEKKTRQPRQTPLQKARFQIEYEIALLEKKLEGIADLQKRREQLIAALETMPSE